MSDIDDFRVSLLRDWEARYSAPLGSDEFYGALEQQMDTYSGDTVHGLWALAVLSMRDLERGVAARDAALADAYAELDELRAWVDQYVDGHVCGGGSAAPGGLETEIVDVGPAPAVAPNPEQVTTPLAAPVLGPDPELLAFLAGEIAGP